MNDPKIIELIREGKSDSALKQLYKYFPVMRKIVTTNGGSITDAEDIFQEALIVLIKKLKNENFMLTAQLSSYLYGICRFLWMDELKKRVYTSTNGLVSNIDIPDEYGITEIVENESRIKLAENVINELKDRCRELLVLFYYGGLRLKDIAAKMGYTSESSVKNQRYKCMEYAKNRLKELQQNL